MLHLHPAVQLSTVKSGGAWKAADLNELQRYRTRNDERDRSGLQRETRRGCFWPLWPPSVVKAPQPSRALLSPSVQV